MKSQQLTKQVEVPMNVLLKPISTNILRGFLMAFPFHFPGPALKIQMQNIVYMKISDGQDDQLSSFMKPEEAIRTIREHIGLGHYVDVFAESIKWSGQNKRVLRPDNCWILIRTDLDSDGNNPRIFHPVCVLETEITLR